MKHPFISLCSRGDDDVCVHVYMHLFVCAYMSEETFFCVLALLSVLNLPLQQKHVQFHLLSSAFYLSIALRQRFPLRSDSRPLRLHGLQWLPQ